MKQFKSTGILVLLVALVAGYAYFFEYKGKIQKEVKELEEKKIIPFSLEDISEFAITTSTGEYALKKEKTEAGTKWFFEKPFKDVASYGAVQGFLSQFGSQVFDDVAAEGANIDYAIYGLDDKINQISFKKEDGKTLTIDVGNAMAMAGKKYIRVNKENKVLIADYFWESQFQKGFNELREKNFVPPEFTISKIEIKHLVPNGVEHLVFHQTDGKWVLAGLLTKDPDQRAIDDVHYQLKNMRASQVFKEGKKPSDLKNLGLSEPEVKVLLADSNSKKLEILFSKNMTGQVYAVTSDRDVIFSLSPTTVGWLNKGVDDYRDKKKPLSFDLTQVEQIDYRSDLASFQLRKEKDEWKSKEKIEGKEIDNAKVVDILSKLSMMKVKKYFDQEVPYQKSGMIELKLKTSRGDEVLDLQWSPKPIDDVFVAKSNLSEKTFGLSMQDVGSLPFQAVVVDPPKPVTKSDSNGMHIPTMDSKEKKIK